MNQLLEAALNYAKRGWPVFPIRPGQKTPLTAHGVKDAVTNETQIRGWWTKWPDANIAVACGKASGVYAVDVDVAEDGSVNGYDSLKAASFIMPSTVFQFTPRGGCHAFYRTADPPANKNGFLPGVDIRGDGYYVLLAPSVHPNGREYAWAKGHEPWNMVPAEYPDFLRPVKRLPAGVPTPPTLALLPAVHSNSDTMRRASLYLAQCDAAVQGQAGHDKLYWAAACMTWGYELSADQAYEILSREYNPRCMPPWDLSNGKDEKDFRRKISESIRKPPNKPRGWLLHEDGYAPVPDECCVSREDIARILGQFNQFNQSKVTYVSTPNETTNPFVEKVRVPDTELDYICKPTGLLGELCAWINATSFKPQPYLTLACSLAFLGALFGRKVRDHLGSRTNIYCMAVAKSSAGKNHAMKKIRQLCMAANCTGLLGGSNFASDSSIEARMSTDPATVFLLDEIGHLLVHIKSGTSKHHAQIISLLMQLYSSAGDIYLGREYAEADKQKAIVQPCCCIYGVTTPKKFSEGLVPEQLEDGWLSRCLVFCSDSEPRKVRGADLSAPPPARLVEMVRAWHKRKIFSPPTVEGDVSQFVVGDPGDMERQDPPPEQIIVPSDADSERRFIGFDDLAEEEAKKDAKLANQWSKGEENARRIALILACSDSYEIPAVKIESADRACRTMKRLIIDFGRRVIPKIVSGRVEADKRRILEVIESLGVEGCVKRDVSRGTRGLNNQQRSALLADLLEAREIFCAPTENGKTVKYWTAEYCPQEVKALYED